MIKTLSRVILEEFDVLVRTNILAGMDEAEARAAATRFQKDKYKNS